MYQQKQTPPPNHNPQATQANYPQYQEPQYQEPQYQQQQYQQQQPQRGKVVEILNATIVTGEYYSKKYQKTKKAYLIIGKLFRYADGGMSLKLDALPMGGQNITFYPIKAKNQPSQ